MVTMIPPRRPTRLAFMALCAVQFAAPAIAGQESVEPRTRDPYWSCGVNCLALIAHMRDREITIRSIQDLLRPRENGDCSIADLERASRAIGLHPVSAMASWQSLPSVTRPCIVQLRSATRYGTGAHYVVLMGLHRLGVITIDPPGAGVLHPLEEFHSDWTGVLVAFPEDAKQERELVAMLQGRPHWISWGIPATVAALTGLLAWSLNRRRVRKTNRATIVPASGT